MGRMRSSWKPLRTSTTLHASLFVQEWCGIPPSPAAAFVLRVTQVPSRATSGLLHCHGCFVQAVLRNRGQFLPYCLEIAANSGVLVHIQCCQCCTHLLSAKLIEPISLPRNGFVQMRLQQA
eukprot:4601501-Amphidinium_carterae.1